jgi:hypothetical protein
MALADELRKLQELHDSGSLTDAEFAAAKAKVLAQPSGGPAGASDEDVQQQLEEIKVQTALTRLDQQWALERESYMIMGRYGYRRLPSKGLSVFGGIAVTIFGIFWTVMALNIRGGFGGPVGFFPLFGVLFILVGIGVSIYSFNKASQYEEALARYRRRRAELLGGDRDIASQFTDERIQESPF